MLIFIIFVFLFTIDEYYHKSFRPYVHIKKTICQLKIQKKNHKFYYIIILIFTK